MGKQEARLVGGVKRSRLKARGGPAGIEKLPLDLPVGAYTSAGSIEMHGGVGSLLAGLRILFSNPVTRACLRAASRRVVCLEDGGLGRAHTLPALASFSGHRITSCTVTTSFLCWLLRTIIWAGVKLLRGDIDEARRAVEDPAVRRGITLILEGLGRYGVTVPQRLPAPFLVVWNFTNMCDLAAYTATSAPKGLCQTS